jgi:hypothetical protein
LAIAICFASSISIRGTPSTSLTVPLAVIVLPLIRQRGVEAQRPVLDGLHQDFL